MPRRENDELLTPDGEFYLRFWMQSPSMEEALNRRWKKLETRPMSRLIFKMLQEQGEIYISEIARATGRTTSRIRQASHHLRWARIIETEQRGSLTYYRLRPGMVEQYQQWLAKHPTY